MFLSGKPLRSAYRLIARDGRVIWFHCDARMMRWEDGRPWCIHGVAFDISDIGWVGSRYKCNISL
jgi:PAS domain-containing protein